MRSAVLLTALWMGSWRMTGEVRPDTARLSAAVRVVRAQARLLPAQLAGIQAELVRWLDACVKEGAGAGAMEAELEEAGLYSAERRTGLVGRVAFRTIQGGEGLLAVTVGVWTGKGCELDETLVLYRREGWKRMGWLSGPGGGAWLLGALAVGAEEAGGRRLAATAWMKAGCSGELGTAAMRVDRWTGLAWQNLLKRDAGARGSLTAAVDGVMVTFRFTEAGRPSVARYKVDGLRAVRQGPLALTRGGFVDEWLRMDALSAARWSSPGASLAQRLAAAKWRGKSLAYESVAKCPGTVPALEIGVGAGDVAKPTYFLVSGAKAAELKMLMVAEKPTPGCREMPREAVEESVLGELPY